MSAVGPDPSDPYATADIPPGEPSAEPEAGSGDKTKPSPAKLLVELAQEQYRLIRSTDARTYAVPRSGPAIAVPLGSKRGLKFRLASSLYRRTGIVASGSALSDCLAVLEGEAADLSAQSVHLRVGHDDDGAIVLDLGTETGHVAVLSPDGWEIRAESPIVFWRSDLSKSFLGVSADHPPTRGGSLDALRGIVNLTESDFRLAVGWVVAAYFARIPHPILFVQGEQGTAKSDLVRTLLHLVDPPVAAERAIPPGEREWGIFARASWAFAYDNITTIPDWFSDLLCKGVTGNAGLQRGLHSDEDIVVFSFLRVMAITTIALKHEMANDLADRILTLEPEVIDERLEAEEVAARRAAALPEALGAIFDLVCKVLKHLPTTRVDKPTRMADFMRILAALDAATGWSTVKDYRDKVTAVGMRLIEGNGLAQALYYLAGPTPSDEPVWEGKASELLVQLRAIAQARGLPLKDFPDNYRNLWAPLQEKAPSLRKAGIDIRKRERTTAQRGYLIYKRAVTTDETEPDPEL